MVTRLPLVLLEQPPAMPSLFHLHVVKDFRGRRVILSQAVNEFGVDPRIFLVEPDREGQNLPFAQTAKAAHR